MRWPRLELRGRLRYRGCVRGPRLSLLHVRLSEAAVRALWGCERRQGAPGPVISFQGSQGSLMVPCGPGEPPRLFAFFLSRCSKDKQQASFECARLALPRIGESRLDTVGSIQEKITICAIESSHPALREQKLQPVKSWGRAVTKLSLGRSITARRSADESYLPGKGSAHHIPEGMEHRVTTASPSTSVPSPVQLLALRPHGKHEPVRQLPGLLGGLGQGWLPGVLQEVVEQDPAESCCCLKEELAGGLWEDSPRHTAPEQRRMALLRHRNQHEGPMARPFLVPLQQSPDGCCSQGARRSHHGVKRLALLNSSDLRGNKRSRVLDSAPGPWERHCLQAANREQLGAQGLQHPRPWSPCRLELWSLEDGASAEEAEEAWKAGDVRQELPCPTPGGSQPSSFSMVEVPDYLRKYHTIHSAEQCRAYEAAFSADYTEYRYLHARIGGALEAMILHEYAHFKRTYPSYEQEKRRCEYLHQKLSHIKTLVLCFEEGRSS